MARNEAKFWKEIRREHNKNKISDHIERRENRINNGMPDVYWASDKIPNHGWLELKWSDEYSKTAKAGLRSNQVVWHHQLNKYYPRSHILLKAGGKYFIFPGHMAKKLEKIPYDSLFDGYSYEKEDFYQTLREILR